MLAGVLGSRQIAVVVGVLLLALAGASGLLLSRDDGPAPPPTAASQRHAQAREVSAALAGLARDPQALVAQASRHEVGAHARRAVPPDATVAPDERSWRPDGVGGGVIAVTISAPGRERARYAAVMVRESGGWKVLATLPLRRRDATRRP